jgi:hypothetical protein
MKSFMAAFSSLVERVRRGEGWWQGLFGLVEFSLAKPIGAVYLSGLGQDIP